MFHRNLLETEHQFTAVDQVVSTAEFLLTSQTHLQWWSIRTCPVRVRLTFSYLLTPWSRAPLEKLTGSAASQEIPRIFGTRRFLTIPTSARHLSLSWANSIQSPPPPPTSRRSILILSSHLRLGLPSKGRTIACHKGTKLNRHIAVRILNLCARWV